MKWHRAQILVCRRRWRIPLTVARRDGRHAVLVDAGNQVGDGIIGPATDGADGCREASSSGDGAQEFGAQDVTGWFALRVANALKPLLLLNGKRVIDLFDDGPSPLLGNVRGCL